ncbi:glucose-1-phosphate thymidylyltransferase [Symbiobacterium terraclitae]|uniref:Glucose-1-phosphate thymidylyltransferase n=1 Tax=Symbiobacterium terraclitae TaxID=557451 RepID=A0ABS4JQL8_9FIRM|nr:glucose-1-phosphate thymidylyltransferase [Symbiobacterium terraclitae]
MQVKALVLFAGRGSRLRPLTHTRAKAALPVAGRPIWQHVFDYLARFGFEEIGVVVSPGQPELEEAVRQWPHLRVHVIQQAEPRGIAHAVATARPFLSDEPFLLYLGDNLTDADLTPALRRFAEASPAALLTLKRVADPSAFGVASLQGERVVGVVEKPADPPSDLAVAGIYLFSPAVHAAIEGLRPSARGELEITDAIGGLIAAGQLVLGHTLTGWWQDAGSVTGLLEANARLLAALPTRIDRTAVLEEVSIEGPVQIGPRAVLRGVRLRGPLVIGADCRVVGSEIGPLTSVGDGVTLEGVRLVNSVLLPGCRLEGPALHLADSVVGAGAQVWTRAESPAALVLGDDAHLLVPPQQPQPWEVTR